MQNSKIEWCHHKFSAGCDNCYAESMAKRNPSVLGIWGDGGTRVVAAETMWRAPLKWDFKAGMVGERRRVFCASMADIFEDRPELVAPRRRLFDVIGQTPNLDWLLLTKRPENVLLLWPGIGERANVWLGTSVENQEQADRRIPELLRVPAAVRFISAEPLLGPVDLTPWLWGRETACRECSHDADCECGYQPRHDIRSEASISWVIVGGESGPHARPMHPDWVRSLRDQCQEAGVWFHFKQWGEWFPRDQWDDSPLINLPGDECYSWADGPRFHMFRDPMGGVVPMHRIGKKTAGRLLDGREWNEFQGPICIGT